MTSILLTYVNRSRTEIIEILSLQILSPSFWHLLYPSPAALQANKRQIGIPSGFPREIK